MHEVRCRFHRICCHRQPQSSSPPPPPPPQNSTPDATTATAIIQGCPIAQDLRQANTLWRARSRKHPMTATVSPLLLVAASGVRDVARASRRHFHLCHYCPFPQVSNWRTSEFRGSSLRASATRKARPRSRPTSRSVRAAPGTLRRCKSSTTRRKSHTTT